MPIAQITNPGAAFGLPTNVSDGLNGQLILEVVNNSGGNLQVGDVVVWDNNTAQSAAFTTSTGAQQLAVSATSYAVTNSAAFTTPSVVVAVGVVPTGFTNPMNLVGLASTKVDGSHITVAWARAGAAGSLPANTTIFQVPNSSGFVGANAATPAGFPKSDNILAQPISLPALTVGTDGGRLVTTTIIAAGGDPLVAGAVSLNGNSGSTQFPLIHPGEPCFLCVGGVARVQVAGVAVATNVAITTAAAQPTCADDAGVAAGNVLGVSLEANTARDAFNTIRAAIKIG